MTKLNKILICSVVLVVVSGTVGLATAQESCLSMDPECTGINEGTVKLPGSKSVYYVDYVNEFKYPFPDETTFLTWYDDFSEVKEVENLNDWLTIRNVTVKPGAKLIQEVTSDIPWKIASNKVYAVSRGGILNWIKTADVAEEIFGEDWATLIIPVPSSYINSYSSTLGSDIEEASDYNLELESGVSTIREDMNIRPHIE